MIIIYFEIDNIDLYEINKERKKGEIWVVVFDYCCSNKFIFLFFLFILIF